MAGGSKKRRRERKRKIENQAPAVHLSKYFYHILCCLVATHLLWNFQEINLSVKLFLTEVGIRKWSSDWQLCFVKTAYNADLWSAQQTSYGARNIYNLQHITTNKRPVFNLVISEYSNYQFSVGGKYDSRQKIQTDTQWSEKWEKLTNCLDWQEFQQGTPDPNLLYLLTRINKCR